MADVTHHTMSENNPGRLKGMIYFLAVVYVMTFLCGFLQATPFNFLNYIFFSLLFIGGIALIRATVKFNATLVTQWVLLLTGISAMLLAILFTGYEWFRLRGLEDFEASVEALLYLVTLFFWILVIGSLVLIRKTGPLNSSQS